MSRSVTPPFLFSDGRGVGAATAAAVPGLQQLDGQAGTSGRRPDGRGGVSDTEHARGSADGVAARQLASDSAGLCVAGIVRQTCYANLDPLMVAVHPACGAHDQDRHGPCLKVGTGVAACARW